MREPKWSRGESNPRPLECDSNFGDAKRRECAFCTFETGAFCVASRALVDGGGQENSHRTASGPAPRRPAQARGLIAASAAEGTGSHQENRVAVVLQERCLPLREGTNVHAPVHGNAHPLE